MDCKNCNKLLNDSQKFCDVCGAKVIENRLTPEILIQQVNEEFISIDNKFLRTFIDLFNKPEAVIDGYIGGLRKKYINVITYYAIALTVLGFQMFLLKEFFPEFLQSQSNAFDESFKASSNSVENPFSEFPDLFNNYQGVIFSIFMPFIAVGTWLIYFDKRRHNYTEHLVINLYITAQTIFFNFMIFMALAIFNVKDYFVASLIATPPMLIYGAFVFKKLYNSTFFNALFRYLIAYIIYMIAFGVIIVLTMIIFVIYLAATGKLNL